MTPPRPLCHNSIVELTATEKGEIVRQIVLAWLIWGVFAFTAYGQAEGIAGFAWLVLAISALLVAVGALLVFTKLAKFIDRLEEHLKKK